MVSTTELISKVYYSLVPGLISIFLNMVWVPLIVVLYCPFKQRSTMLVASNDQFDPNGLHSAFKALAILLGHLLGYIYWAIYC